MSWFAAVPSFIFALAVFVLPGLPIAFAMGTRGISFVALCIGGSVSAIAAAAVVAPFVGIPWQPYTPFLVSVPLAILGYVLRRWWLRYFSASRNTHDWGWPFVAALIGLLLGAVLIAIPLKAGIGMPDWPAQAPDASFHLNAVRLILDTGNASSFSIDLGLPPSAVSFYPAAWHAIVALVVQLSGAGIVVATNMTSFAVACVVWPVGCIFLSRQLFGARKLTLILTGLLSGVFAAFPLSIVAYGVLYPYLLGVALMPIAFGLVVLAVRRAAASEMEPPGVWLMFCWVLFGVGVAHPSAVLGVIALSIPLIAEVIIRYLVRLHRRGKLRVRGTIAGAAFLVGVVLYGFIWLKAGQGTGKNFTRPYQTLAQAFGEAITNGPLERPAAIAVSVLMIVGIALLIYRKHQLWLVASYLITVGLFMVATGWYPGHLRSALVGIWYNNLPRLAALLPLFAIPLAVGGATAIVSRLQKWIVGFHTVVGVRRLRPRRITEAIAVLAVVILIPLTQDASIAHIEKVVKNTYSFSRSSALLSPDELAIFDVVRNITPRQAVIAGNPWNGSALVYAYTDRKALFPYLLGNWGSARWDLAAHFTAATPKVCQAIRNLGVTYVLGFGKRYLTPANPRVNEYPGFNGLAHSDIVTPIARRGSATLYKVTGCGLGDSTVG